MTFLSTLCLFPNMQLPMFQGLKGSHKIGKVTSTEVSFVASPAIEIGSSTTGRGLQGTGSAGGSADQGGFGTSQVSVSGTSGSNVPGEEPVQQNFEIGDQFVAIPPPPPPVFSAPPPFTFPGGVVSLESYLSLQGYDMPYLGGCQQTSSNPFTSPALGLQSQQDLLNTAFPTLLFQPGLVSFGSP
jgi:hypothetical protein